MEKKRVRPKTQFGDGKPPAPPKAPTDGDGGDDYDGPGNRPMTKNERYAIMGIFAQYALDQAL